MKGKRSSIWFFVVFLILYIGDVTATDLVARIQSVNTSGSWVFFPEEPVRLRVAVLFNRGERLAAGEVSYEVYDFNTGAQLDSGTAPFNQPVNLGGWVEVAPNLPPKEGIQWYRMKLVLQDGDREIPLVDPITDADVSWFSFGVVGPDSFPWRVSLPDEAIVDPERKVMAFYYPWYGNPAVSGQWHHWPEGGHQPAVSDAQGLPDIGATQHPLLGPYDAHDPRVIRQHLLWAEAAGIDVLIATWWGRDSFSDQALPLLLDLALETNVQFSFYYETNPAGTVEAALADFRYILSRYGDHPAVFRHQGAPVIFVYGRAMGQLSREQWAEVLTTLKQEYDVYVIADSLDGRWADIFDGLHIYNPVGPVVRGTNMQHLYQSLVWEAQSRGKIATATIMPGYDDSNIGRPSPTIAPRRDGAVYDELWQLAIASRPQWIIICTFNEWHEGSEIEPSIEHGDFYLRKTAQWAYQFKTAPPRSFWLDVSSIPVVLEAGREYLIQVEVLPLVDDDQLTLEAELPEGWVLKDMSVKKTASGRLDLSAVLVVPATAQPGEYYLKVPVSLAGYTMPVEGFVTVVPASQLEADVWIELGASNKVYGLVQRDHEDGVTTPVTIDGVPARKTAPGVSSHKYMYFDIADSFLFNISGVTVEIGVEYLDAGTGVFRVQYDSHNPQGDLNGAYMDGELVRLEDTGQWRWARFVFDDARFANRQNSATDFRLACGTGDLVVRRVYLRVLSAGEQDLAGRGKGHGED